MSESDRAFIRIRRPEILRHLRLVDSAEVPVTIPVHAVRRNWNSLQLAQYRQLEDYRVPTQQLELYRQIWLHRVAANLYSAENPQEAR